MQARNETQSTYYVPRRREIVEQDDDACVRKALQILARRLKQPGALLDSPQTVRDYLSLSLAGLEHEEFHVLFVDAHNRLIATEAMFRGTLTQTSVYPREVVKATLRHNACAVIFAHNHPSGNPAPSAADERLTNSLKTALDLIDVRVLDHLVVAGITTTSFAERGLI